MTVVFTGVIPRSLIVMAVDSAVTQDFGETREYVKDVKAFWFSGVGCVATWGERTGNRIADFLYRQNISEQTHSVDDLAELVYEYLTEDYRPHEAGLGEVGYHVAGYDGEGNHRVFHVFYGFDRPKPEDQEKPVYRCQTFSRGRHSLDLLFNGRNDLAYLPIRVLFNEIDRGGDPRYVPGTPKGLACLADFVVRFAGEVTQEVGPPFFIHLISPTNRRFLIQNHAFCPIAESWDDEVMPRAREEGFPL